MHYFFPPVRTILKVCKISEFVTSELRRNLHDNQRVMPIGNTSLAVTKNQHFLLFTSFKLQADV